MFIYMCTTNIRSHRVKFLKRDDVLHSNINEHLRSKRKGLLSLLRNKKNCLAEGENILPFKKKACH